MFREHHFLPFLCENVVSSLLVPLPNKLSTLLWWNTNNNNNNNNQYHLFHVKLKRKRWTSPLEKPLCIQQRLDRSRSPFSRGIFENCIDKRKQRIKGSRTKRKQKERRGLPFSRDLVSAGCQDKDSRRSGRVKRERPEFIREQSHFIAI